MLAAGLSRHCAGPHELILAARIADGVDDLGLITRPDAPQRIVERFDERRAAIAHDRHEMRAGLRVLIALAQSRRERDQSLLQLGVIVLARPFQVDAVLAHQAALRRLRPAGREQHSLLRVPRVAQNAHFGIVGAAGVVARHLEISVGQRRARRARFGRSIFCGVTESLEAAPGAILSHER